MTTLKFQQVEATPEWWKRTATFADQLVFQTESWIRFIAVTQNAIPVFAEIYDGSSQVGCFSSLLISRFGVKILGSPFPGWGTTYMGFNLQPEVPRYLALEALEQFAFKDMGCAHFEIADHLLTSEDGLRAGLEPRFSYTYEHDLTKTENEILMQMHRNCRSNIRTALKRGVTVEEACADDEFASDYYDQLRDVFSRQRLLPTYSFGFVKQLIRHMHNTGHLLLLRARDPEGKCVATGIYLGMKNFAQVWGNASFRSYRYLRPNQALHWYAIRYWRARGAQCFDWGGGGAYKQSYGCKEVVVHGFCKSRAPCLSALRDLAQRMFYFHQKVRGRLHIRANKHAREELPTYSD